MVTVAALNKMISSLYEELSNHDFKPTGLVLFGSYAKNKARNESDIDVAIWHPSFTGSKAIDKERIAPALRNFPKIEIHTFSSNDTADENPFIEEIMKYGIIWHPGDKIVIK